MFRQPVPWGLNRISQRRALTTLDPVEGAFKYTFDDSATEPVDIYIIGTLNLSILFLCTQYDDGADSGIYVEHGEFEGRARWGYAYGAHPEASTSPTQL